MNSRFSGKCYNPPNSYLRSPLLLKHWVGCGLVLAGFGRGFAGFWFGKLLRIITDNTSKQLKRKMLQLSRIWFSATKDSDLPENLVNVLRGPYIPRTYTLWVPLLVPILTPEIQSTCLTKTWLSNGSIPKRGNPNIEPQMLQSML